MRDFGKLVNGCGPGGVTRHHLKGEGRGRGERGRRVEGARGKDSAQSIIYYREDIGWYLYTPTSKYARLNCFLIFQEKTILYSSKSPWHNIFVNFVINLKITKILSTKLEVMRWPI